MVNPASGSSQQGKLDQAKGLLGFLVAGFAAVLSFIGIKSSELSAILRNLEPLVSLVAIAFFLSILAAVISIYAPAQSGSRPSWPTVPMAVGTTLLIAAAGAALSAAIRIPLVTTSHQVQLTQTVAWVLLGTGLAALLLPLLRLVPRLKGWRIPVMDRQLYFILVSVMLLAVGGYTALHLESADQDAPFTQVSASVTKAGPDTALLSVTVDSAKIPAADRVNVYVNGVPRSVTVASLCAHAKVGPGDFPCYQDPCLYARPSCQSLGVWQLPPDASGDVRQVIEVPLTLSAYQRVNVNGQVCLRAKASGKCQQGALVGSHLDLQLPPEPAPG